MSSTPMPTAPSNFIRDIILRDNETGKHQGRVHTRFPPEPNGYLHIGHAKSICINFGFAKEFGGQCNLRFDDTNPSKEDVEYVESIQEDVKWLGWDWEDRLYYASDYFEQLYRYAEQLIQSGLAFVCELSAEEMRQYRGTLKEPGRPSPWRDRPVAENLDLFRRMRAGEFAEGSKTLRAKIDMASPNINMRDPVIYRILKATHHRTGDRWCIYPMYDYTHCISDALEGITHSICTLEFEDHRPLYDWCLDKLQTPCHPQQIEFARLNLTYTVMSKRKLLELVNGKVVSGWDDPRMPTLAGMRRRGYPPEAIRDFCERIGLAKVNSTVDFALLEHCVREVLNREARRVMAVLRPLKLTIANYPEGQVETFEAVNNPEDPASGTRPVTFSRQVWIERDDFQENPPKQFFRLAPGREIRLKHAYIVRCEEVVKDPATGEVTELICSYDPATRGGDTPDGRVVKGTAHWVGVHDAVDAEVRLYDQLFTVPMPGEPEGADYRTQVNPASLEVLTGCKVEPLLAAAAPGQRFQFLRQGYFTADSDSTAGKPVFNRTATLRDTWAKIAKKTS